MPQGNFKIETVDISFELDQEKTVVQNTMSIIPISSGDLIFNGECLELLKIAINNEDLNKSDYVLTEEELHLKVYPKERFTLSITNQINPKKNTALEGLYFADNIFCTQNEPEGFRRITYFMDRPDNMSVFRTRLTASKKECPVLLSNGNLIDSGDLDGGKHFAVWEDPFKKPSYLFALVAGDLGKIEDTFKTKSNRDIELKIFCDKGNEYKLHFAMESLKNSMKWDEDVYGLEYDLDNYMIVAVDSFNMGAMENKGLNVFNTACVMADPKAATDHDYHVVEGVIGHEYFHNWTGNRVTCRDWFQLTLKEGLTVFRDQEFSSDMSDRTVQRIGDVNALRLRQFPEDMGPMSHPIRPRSYIQINNFYTATVYNKGAEIIRMVHTLLGAQGFRAGMDEYFKRYDGQAVTCEDFISAMEAGGKQDLSHFRQWYDQKGVPEVTIKQDYDKQSQTYRLHLSQNSFDHNGESCVLQIPLRIGLLGRDGKNLSFSEPDLLNLNENEKEFTFKDIPVHPVLSLNQGFSAPVILKNHGSEEDLRLRLAYDNDGYNRWDSGQELVKRKVLNFISGGEKELFNETDLEAFGVVIKDKTIGNALKAEILTLPGLGYLLQDQMPRKIEETHKAVKSWKLALVKKYEIEFAKLYEDNHEIKKEYQFEKDQVASRRIKNCALGYLCSTEDKKYLDMAHEQFLKATNHTDEIFAFAILVGSKSGDYDHVTDDFSKKWKDDALVMDKWFLVQAGSENENTLENVKKLLKHPNFEINNPNKVRSLIGGFMRNNLRFNAINGAGYSFLAEMIITLDVINPSMASALANGFQGMKRMDGSRKSMIEEQLKDIAKKPGLSKNTFEVVSKILDL